MGVALDVPQGLGGGPVDEALVVRRQARPVLDLDRELGRDPPRFEPREQVDEGRLEPARPQVRWVDLEEQRAEAPHRVARRGRCVVQRFARPGRRLGLGSGAERVRDPGEVLNRPVVEVGGDPAPLVGRRLDGPDEQRLTILGRPLQAAAEPPRERDLDEPEEDEAAEQERSERQPDPSTGRLDRAAPLVRLEQEGRPVRRADRHVDLVEVALALLEAVLRTGEVRPLRSRLAVSQRLLLGRVERETGSDQTRLVRVDDAAVAVPELDPDNTIAEHALVDDSVDIGDRGCVALEERRVERGLHDALSRERRELPRVAERLVVGEAPQREE